MQTLWIAKYFCSVLLVGVVSVKLSSENSNEDEGEYPKVPALCMRFIEFFMLEKKKRGMKNCNTAVTTTMTAA